MADNTSTGSSGSAAKASDSSKKVGLIGLVGIVISAMIGGGIYNLPQNMAADASAGAIIIAWVVTGIGIWFIANTFRILSAARPELTNGLYTYAEKGFGKLIGFFVAYGYWICNCFALVAYSVLVMATLNYFVPDFSGGNNIPSIIGGSIITWIMYLLALQGAKSTSFLNIIGTIGKLLPVAIFIIAVATVFKFSVFMEGFWGMKGAVDLTFSWDNVMPQVQATMLVTLWLFLGIEGAVVVSGKAKSQAAVRKATTIGFLVTLALYIIVSLLPLGVYSQADVGAMADPSMAAIMLDKFGKWGEILVNAGVIVSVLSSWLVWMLMLGEMPLAASKSGIFPKAFVKENKKGSPSTALLWTTIIVQIVLVISFFIGSNAWTTMISITSVMALPCYLLLHALPVQDRHQEGVPEGHLRQPEHGGVHRRGRLALRTVAHLRRRAELPHGGVHRVRRRPAALHRGRAPARPQGEAVRQDLRQGHRGRGGGAGHCRAHLFHRHVRARQALGSTATSRR